MTSKRQAEANRQNAQKSTGPRTSAGKAAVALNGIKHGSLERIPVMFEHSRHGERSSCILAG
jgi:hypothetical protein